MRQAIGGVARPTLQSGRFEMTSARIGNDRVRDAKFFAARGVDRISEQVQFGWRKNGFAVRSGVGVRIPSVVVIKARVIYRRGTTDDAIEILRITQRLQEAHAPTCEQPAK